MLRLRMAATAACFFALSSGQVFASDAGQCWQPYEVEAAKVRDLQIMLMLGALRCKGTDKGIEAQYSAFAEKKSGLLSSYNNVLKTRFMRVNGISDGQKAYAQFNTKLGNSHSGMAQAGSYCQMTSTLLTLAMAAQDRELPQLATQFSESKLGIDSVCEAQPVAAAVAAEEAPAVTQTPAPHEAVTAAGMASAAKAEEPAAQPVSAAAALEAAAVALQNAAASLKASPAPQADPATAKAAGDAADKPAAVPEAKPAQPQPVTASAMPVG